MPTAGCAARWPRTDGPGVKDALDALDQVLARALATEATWREVRELLQERRLISETERRRLTDLHQTVTLTEFMLFVNAVIAIVSEHVPEPQAGRDREVRHRSLLTRNAPTRSGRVPVTVDATAKATGPA